MHLSLSLSSVSGQSLVLSHPALPEACIRVITVAKFGKCTRFSLARRINLLSRTEQNKARGVTDEIQGLCPIKGPFLLSAGIRQEHWDSGKVSAWGWKMSVHSLFPPADGRGYHTFLLLHPHPVSCFSASPSALGLPWRRVFLFSCISLWRGPEFCAPQVGPGGYLGCLFSRDFEQHLKLLPA